MKFVGKEIEKNTKKYCVGFRVNVLANINHYWSFKVGGFLCLIFVGYSNLKSSL